MYVLVLVAAFYVGDADPPLAMITRPSIQHYPSEEACKADGSRQVKAFAEGMPQGAIGFAAKCVEVSGPVGQPA